MSSYRFALERLVIMSPMMQAADVERRLNHLDATVAHYRTYTAPTLEQKQSLALAR